MIKNEILCGYKNNFSKLLISFILTIVFNIINIYMIKKGYNILYTSESYVFDLFKGVEYLNNNMGMQIPYIWIICNSVVISMSSSYLEEEKFCGSIHIISRCGKKKFWFLKEGFCIINTITWYIIIFFTTIFIAKLSFEHICNFKFYLQIEILYILTSIMLVIINSTLSIFMKRKYSHIITLLLTFTSIFTNFKLMPGQQSILLRHVPYNMVSGITTVYSIIYDILISAICLYIQYKYVEYKDIY